MTAFAPIVSAFARKFARFCFSQCRAWAGRPLLVFGLLLSGNLGFTTRAADEVFPQREVKANMLTRFAQFVEWPEKAFAGKESPIVIGILGDDPFGAALDKAAENKTPQGRPLIVKRYKDLRAIGDCHILFISPAEARRLPDILDALRNRNILTVGDTDGFAQRGGAINFFRNGNSVGLEANMNAAERAGLKFSAQFRRLLKEVRTKP